MKRRLCIGTYHPSPALVSVLTTLGVHYEEISYAKPLLKNYSLLIIESDADFPSDKRRKILDYLSDGGGLLEIGLNFEFHLTNYSTTKFVRYLSDNSQNEAYSDIPFIDIYFECALSESVNMSFDGLVTLNNKNVGPTAGIGLPLQKIWIDNSYKRKRFQSPHPSLPDEIVSSIDREAISDLIRQTIKDLLYQQELPYLALWSSPQEQQVFCFRIDSDYGSRQSVEELYNVAVKYGRKLTWFLHVEAHEEWLNYFRTFQNQEIALHGYKHGYSSSTKDIEANIEAGLHKLEDAGLEISGYCAPYGLWNKQLEKALEDYAFTYTSEFTLGYDGHPFRVGSNPLQIPTHPICTGSLNRKGYDEQQMLDYFMSVIKLKNRLHKPVILYHHPLQPGLNVIEEVFIESIKEEYVNLSFDEYAHFWKKRSDFKFNVSLEDEEVKVNCETDSNLYFEYSTNFEGFSLNPVQNQTFKLSQEPKISHHETPLIENINIKKLKTKSWQLHKTSLVDWKNREKL